MTKTKTPDPDTRIDPGDDDNVIRRRDGVGAYGLYVAFVIYHTETLNLLREDRFFLYGRLLCRYSRSAGDGRAAWRPRNHDTPEIARQEMLDEIERRAHYKSMVALEIVHKPLLIELTEADIEAVAQGEAPGARHEGIRIVEKVCGKINDEEWRPLSALTGTKSGTHGGVGVTGF